MKDFDLGARGCKTDTSIRREKFSQTKREGGGLAKGRGRENKLYRCLGQKRNGQATELFR